MNERSRNMMYWCLFITTFGIQVCNAYSASNIIKDYHNKDYLVSASSASVVNKFEDNEIRGW